MAKAEKKEVAVIDFTKFSVAQLPELQGKKEEIKGIIEANPIVEIIDNSTYELAKKSRTAVKTLRTSLEKEQKEVNSRIKKNVLEVIASEYDSLIGQVKEKESERQEPITIWEDKKEQERLEKLRLEEERIQAIKSSIDEFMTKWETTISQTKFENIEEVTENFKKAVDEFDIAALEKFDVIFNHRLSSLSYSFSEKKAVLIAQETNRLEQIRLDEERKDTERKIAIRNEIQSWLNNWSATIDALSFFNYSGYFENFKNEKALDCQEFQSEYAEIRNSLVQKFESKIALLNQIEKQRIAQEEFQKEKEDFEAKQAEAKYQERIKRLTDVGCTYFEETNCFQKNGFFYNCEDIKNSSDELFERELQDAKNSEVVESVFNEDVQEVIFEGPSIEYIDPKDTLPLGTTDKIDEITNNDAFISNYHEEDVDVKGIIVNDEEVVSENIKFESLDEITWESIYDEFEKETHYDEYNSTILFTHWLSENFLVPERKK